MILGLNRFSKRKKTRGNVREPKHRIPPAIAEWLATTVTPRRFQETLLGDLTESFGTWVDRFGRRCAVMIYWYQVAVCIPQFLVHECKQVRLAAPREQHLPMLVQLALGGELFLDCVEKLEPRAHGVLPLGGGHLIQIGILLSIAICLAPALGWLFGTTEAEMESTERE